MELEVGMYVRFKTLSNEVKIGQIKLIDNNIYELDNNEVTSDKYIIKASHTLLGNNEEPCLIEVGDYVNGEKVTSIETNGWLGFRNHDLYLSDESEIKSIVTKEQFESMSYKVGD